METPGLVTRKRGEITILLLICATLSSSQDGQGSIITLTVNSSSCNNLLCPEVALWTCNVTNASVARIEIIQDSNNSILLMSMKNSLNFSYYYSNIVEDTYVTSMLIIDNEELVNHGYTFLTCGNVSTKIQYPLILDNTDPGPPLILFVDFYINKSNSVLAYKMAVSSKAYFSSCKYKRNSSIVTSLQYDGAEKMLLTTTTLNSSDCNNSLCIIQSTFSKEKLLSGSLSLLIESFNKHARSSPLFYNLTMLNDFNFNITSKNCGLIAQCTASLPLLDNICIINYKKTSESTAVVAHIPVNKQFLFNLSHDTIYHMNITFKTGNGTIYLQQMLKTSKTGMWCSGWQTLMIIISTCLFFLALVFCVIGCFICICICFKIKRSNFKDSDTVAEKIHSEFPAPLSLQEESRISNHFDLCGGHQSFNIVNGGGFESSISNAIPTVEVMHQLDPYVDTRSYSTLERNAMTIENQEMKAIPQINLHHQYEPVDL